MTAKNNDLSLKQVVTLQNLAPLLGISERQIQRLTKQGIFRHAKNRDGQFVRARYVLGEALPSYIEYLRNTFSSDPNEAAYASARARRMQAAAEAMELELKVKKSKLYQADDIEFYFGLMLRNFRDRALGIPSRVMHQLVGVANAREANEIVNTEVRLALTEMSNFDFSNFKEETAAYLESNGVSREIQEQFEREKAVEELKGL